jgi:two-component sensor histidine kinase
MIALAQLRCSRWIPALCAEVLLVSAAMAGQGPAAGGSPLPAQGVPPDRRQILVLNGNQYGLQVADSVNRGLFSALTESGVSGVDIFVEHLDLVREPSHEHWVNEANLLRFKLSDCHIGIIVAETALANDFLTREGKDIFPDAAVLTLLNTKVGPGGPRMVMDMSDQVDAVGTLRAALDLFPGTRTVFVVAGGRDDIFPFLERTKQEFAPWTNKLDFEYANAMSYDGMLRRVSNLPSDAIVIYMPYFADNSGRPFMPLDVLDKVCREASAPVFATLEIYLGHGIVGGSLARSEMIGKQAAKVALDYLSGRLKLVEPVTTFDTSPVPMFDWRELTRWKADTSRLPEGSIVMNRPVTLWGEYRDQVMAAMAVFLALSGLVVALLILNLRLRRVEAALRASLAEKIALLKEVHHRVKNNLQIVSSLLSLQSSRVRNPLALGALQDTQNRVHSMALIHETLYRSENLAQVNFPAYIENLCAHLLGAFGVDPGRIELVTHVAREGLELEEAVPCGLIINELVSNAFKHAFPAGRAGRVTVELQTEPGGLCALRVADNGIGLPAGLDLRHTDTLGLQLVSNLADQLGGALEVERTSGTAFRLTFQASASHDRAQHER